MRHQRLIFALRLLALVVFGGLPLVVIFGERWWPASETRALRYRCPMHPEVDMALPDICPICRMKLEPYEAAPHAHTASGPAASGRSQTSPAVTIDAEAAERRRRDSMDVATRRVFPLAVQAPAWVTAEGKVAALLHRDEQSAPRELPAWFSVAARPAERVAVRPAQRPFEAWDDATVIAPFDPLPDSQALRPGDTGWVELAAERRELVVVPYPALLEYPGGPYVLVASEDRKTYVRRRVEVGRIFSGLAVIVSGIEAGERVAAQDAFLLDAELRLHGDAPLSGASR